MRRPPRRSTAPVEVLVELDPVEVIPPGAPLVAAVRWDRPTSRAIGIIGIYEVDLMRELVRPRCTCSWTTEGSTLFTREAVDRLAVHVERDCSCRGPEMPRPCRCGAEALRSVLLAHVEADHGGTSPLLRRC